MDPTILILLKGFLVGILISLPTGPAGFLSVERMLVHGLWAGILSALGMAVADFMFSMLGTAELSLFTMDGPLRLSLRLIGGILLIWLGFRMYRPKKEAPKIHRNTFAFAGDFFSAFFVSLSNPTPIITFPFIFTLVGIQHDTIVEGPGAIPFALSVALGGFLFWVGAGLLITRHKNSFNGGFQIFIERTIGVILFCFGIFLLASLLWHL